MEIFKDNLEGEWRIADDGEPYFFFIKGCLLGLQSLGDATEPCFEGSAFFSLNSETFKDMTDYMKNLKKEEE